MNTFIKRNIKYFQSLLLALTLGACGGGTQVAEVGGNGTGITASGTITGFGSVFVNGVKFSTSTSTSISDDGANKTESELKIGQVVEIKGKSVDSANGNADSILVIKELKGPVDKLYDASVTPKTIGVLGQTVIIDNNTIVDNNIGANGLAGLAIGVPVEVSGFRETSGNLRATRIELQNSAAATQYKLRGSIGSIASATSFKVGNITVNYAGVTVQNLPAGGLVPGLQVEVRGGKPDSNNVLTATRVEVKKGVDGKEGDKAEVEGLITNFDANCKFNVNGQAVDACGSVQFQNGVKADLADGKRVEAEGSLTNGVLVASKVEFKANGGSSSGGGSGDIEAEVKLSSLVQSTTVNTINVLGKSFTVNSLTQFEDDKDNTRPFNLGNFATVLKQGDHATITAFADAAGNLTATRVERDGRSEVFAQGKLENLTAVTMTIQGVAVTIGTSTKFRKIDGSAFASFTEFQASVAGKTVFIKAKGTNNGAADNTVNATNGEVEIED